MAARPPIRRSTSPGSAGAVADPGWLRSQAGAPRKREVRRARLPLSARACRVAAAAIGLGVALGVGGWFPTYLAGSGTLAAQVSEILLHGVPLLAWIAGALALLAGRPGPARFGVALAGGSAAVVSGLDVSIFGHLVAVGFGSARAGLWLTLGGNLVADAGVAAGIVALVRAGELGWPERPSWPWLAAGVVAAAVAGTGYVPGWEVYHLYSKTLKQHAVEHATSGFSNAWEVVVGEVVVMVALAPLVVLASQWAHRRSAAGWVLGVVVGLCGLVAETSYELATPGSASTLGIPASAVKEYKLTIHVGYADWFLVELGGLAALLLLAGALAAARPRRA